MKKRVIIIIFLIMLAFVSVMVYRGQHNGAAAKLYYSGTVEATESELAFQAPGRVTEVLVDEGYRVETNQILARLDQAEYQARHEEAEAGLNKSVKSLQQLETRVTIYERSLPAEVVRAEANLAGAQDFFAEARKNKERYDSLIDDHVVSERDWDTVTLTYDIARARLRESEAVLQQAQSNLSLIEATHQEIEAARAQVQVAEAALKVASIQLRYTELRAPFGGIITSRNVEPGEVIAPTREVLTLADLSTVDLKIFVDESDLGRVKPGQKVEVRIDTFPDKVYHGSVGYISPEGEFTPKIIQTHKERIKLVYLVKVVVPNPDLELKTGMPADAWLKAVSSGSNGLPAKCRL